MTKERLNLGVKDCFPQMEPIPCLSDAVAELALDNKCEEATNSDSFDCNSYGSLKGVRASRQFGGSLAPKNYSPLGQRFPSRLFAMVKKFVRASSCYLS